MKKVLIALSIIMIFPLFFLYINSIWFVKPNIKSDFSKAQITEICDQFKIVLLPGESITTEYFPGVLQATKYISITVNNIDSESDFLSRFSGEIDDNTLSNGSDIQSKYDISIFELSSSPKDYSSSLEFIDNIDDLSAKIHISGHIPQLKEIYRMCNDPLQPFFSNWLFMLFLGIELVLILGIILHTFIARKK